MSRNANYSSMSFCPIVTFKFIALVRSLMFKKDNQTFYLENLNLNM